MVKIYCFRCDLQIKVIEFLMCFCFNLFCFHCEGIFCNVSHQSLQQPGMVVKVFNLSVQEAETETFFCDSRSQGLCSELQASQDYN